MENRKLSNRDINKASLFWWLTSHMTYNYQRLQAGSFAGMMGPILNKLYPDNKQKLEEGLERHMLYFNTEPRWGAIIPGMTVALEESLANDTSGELDVTMITEIKTALMGPLAGIGDTVWAGLIKPVILSITLGWAMQGYIWGAFAYGLGLTLLDFMITRVMFARGYKLGMESIDKFLEGGFIAKVTSFLGIVGLFCLGVMIVKYVKIGAILEVEMTTGTLNIGDILDKIFPCLLPLSFTLLGYWLQKKGQSVTKVLLVLFVIGFIGGAIGFLG